MKPMAKTVVALAFVMAGCAIWAGIASAEVTLLADWLLNGAEVVSRTEATWQGETVYEDSKADLGITCSEIWHIIIIGPSGEDILVEKLTLSGLPISLTSPLLCKSHKFCEESATDIEFSEEDLPALTLLFLVESGQFRDAATGYSYFVSCLVLGIKVSEECTANSSYEVKNVTGGIEGIGKWTPNGTCTVGGSGSGEITWVAGNVLSPVSGGTLTVSSE